MGTSVQCFGTPTNATALLLRGQTRLCSVLQNSYLYYDTSVTWASTSLFNTVLYLRVPIVLCPYHSLLLVYRGKHLYNKNLNNEQ